MERAAPVKKENLTPMVKPAHPVEILREMYLKPMNATITQAF